MAVKLEFQPAIREDDDETLEQLLQELDAVGVGEWTRAGACLFPLGAPLDLMDRHGRRIATVVAVEVRIREESTTLVLRFHVPYTGTPEAVAAD